jgi:hypothetical protein
MYIACFPGLTNNLKLEEESFHQRKPPVASGLKPAPAPRDS